jgi:hypothetical protein
VVWIHKPKPSPESSESAETCGESTQHATGRQQPPTLSPRNPVHIRRNLKTLDAGNPAQPRLSAAAWWSLALASPRGMEHDAHAEAPPPQQHVLPPEDAEPMAVDSGTPTEGAGDAAPDATAAAPEPPSEGERTPLPTISSRVPLCYFTVSSIRFEPRKHRPMVLARLITRWFRP